MTPAEIPAIPDTFFSLLGPMPIVRISDEDAAEDEKFGEWFPTSRHIEIGHFAPQAEWSTLWHEAIHSALFDCGVNNAITDQQCEIVCDAVGTYLTAMMLAGQLTISGKDTALTA